MVYVIFGVITFGVIITAIGIIVDVLDVKDRK